MLDGAKSATACNNIGRLNLAVSTPKAKLKFYSITQNELIGSGCTSSNFVFVPTYSERFHLLDTGSRIQVRQVDPTHKIQAEVNGQLCSK